jgi:hypothetical protein
MTREIGVTKGFVYSFIASSTRATFFIHASRCSGVMSGCSSSGSIMAVVPHRAGGGSVPAVAHSRLRAIKGERPCSPQDALARSKTPVIPLATPNVIHPGRRRAIWVRALVSPERRIQTRSLRNFDYGSHVFLKPNYFRFAFCFERFLPATGAVR